MEEEIVQLCYECLMRVGTQPKETFGYCYCDECWPKVHERQTKRREWAKNLK